MALKRLGLTATESDAEAVAHAHFAFTARLDRLRIDLADAWPPHGSGEPPEFVPGVVDGA